ncbi:hypothetical protein CCUS01_05926 [Colletotrichum cuscutae]|uniref:Transcription-silencing protein Clr2 n=1 Tax=Colletotrichum cuscutae TaxID=1209917 RepID=A0AAI9V5E1_9PEZI|nr:hypothetical protein CCUS01_05926 [Colletotrichum cuscutae]
MSDLVEYSVVNVCRSDGQDNGAGYWPTPADTAAKNAKKTALEKVPRAKPQMVRLDKDDARFQDWRIKLGILLKQELSPTEGLPWLLHFPRGYWLYEKSKHLWVSGHPVKSKLYKSPQEFGLHVLWLLSGSMDRTDCRCIHCNVREMPNMEDLTVSDVPRPLPAASNTQPPSKMRKITPQIPPGVAGSPIPVPAAASTPPIAKKETPVPISSGWRLGIVAATGIINPNTNKAELQILPMSHVNFNQSPIQTLEATTRPFLAFSVPNVSISDLQNKAYDEVDWDAFFQTITPEDTHRREVALLDSSKMAAQKVGVSFSVFSRLSETNGGKKIDYHGIFLGAERIELGDVLRVRLSAEQGVPPAAANLPDALLGLREICTAPIDSPGNAFFKGDIYQPITGDNQPVGGIPVPDDKLPRPLRDEIAFRNKFAASDRWRCVLLKQNAVLREPDLKGRFYPTHKLLPLLDGQAKVLAEVQKGIVRDVQQRLNQRIDTFKTAYIGQKRTRVETFGPALPPGSVIQFEQSVREDGA